jgi:ATP-dependent RNA helicase DeaD
MTGKDLIGKSETGSGKTFAFALPIVDRIKPNKHVQALILTLLVNLRNKFPYI